MSTIDYGLRNRSLRKSGHNGPTNNLLEQSWGIGYCTPPGTPRACSLVRSCSSQKHNPVGWCHYLRGRGTSQASLVEVLGAPCAYRHDRRISAWFFDVPHHSGRHLLQHRLRRRPRQLLLCRAGEESSRAYSRVDREATTSPVSSSSEPRPSQSGLGS